MNRFIVADAEKCIGCRTCEVACAVSHQDAVSAHAFTPRLRVVKGDDYTTAVGCHQCEVAPSLLIRQRECLHGFLKRFERPQSWDPRGFCYTPHNHNR